MDKGEFGVRLKRYRAEAKLTQAQFAERLGVHLQTVSKWERGVTEPDISQLGAIASVCDVSLEKLMGIEESEDSVSGDFSVQSFSKNLADLRHAAHEEQRQLAADTGVSVDAVSKWERGVICPDMTKLVAIAGHYGVSLSRLYYGLGGGNSAPPSTDGATVRERPKNTKKLWIALCCAAVFIVAACVLLSGIILKNNGISSGLNAGGVQDVSVEVQPQGASGGEGKQAVAHVYVKSKVEPTCTEGGYTVYVCECGDSYTADYVKPLGHTEEVTEGVAPTCTEYGYTQGRRCKRCRQVFQTRQPIQPLGHSFEGAECKTCHTVITPTDDSYFEYALLSDGTYEVSARDIDSLPSEVVIPVQYMGAEVTAIARLGFYGCEKIRSLIIPESIAKIGDSAFAACPNLESVYYTGGVAQWFEVRIETFNFTRPHDMYFAGVLYSELTVPEGVKAVKANYLSYCRNIVSVVLSDTVTEVGEYAFELCENLKKVVLPYSVERVGLNAFYRSDSAEIYCEANELPSSWDSGWNGYDLPVVWGYRG